MKRTSWTIGIYLPCALALLLALQPLTARAQFNGPGAGSGVRLNQSATITTDPALLRPPQPDFKLANGDMIGIHVYGVAEFNLTVRVSVDGSVQLPLIGAVNLQGLTVQEAEKLIARKLIADGMIKDPQVSVQVVEAPNRVATVTGEVRTPSVVPILGQRHLIDVLSAVGGLNPTASHLITIDRPSLTTPITVDLGTDPARSRLADIPIFAGDTIIVPRTGVVYCLGAFRAQGAFPLNGSTPLTLMQAVALAGGANYEGKLDDARIVRTVGNDRKEVPINIKKITHGRAPDPILQADDIIFLPTSGFKAAIKAGGVGTVIGLAGVLLYIVPTL